jgi:hypothetical protein
MRTTGFLDRYAGKQNMYIIYIHQCMMYSRLCLLLETNLTYELFWRKCIET